MKDNKVRSIILLIMLSIALFVGVILVRQNQDMRRSAYFADNIKVFLLPEESQAMVGDVVPIQVWVSTGEAKVDGVQADICYGDGIKLPENATELYDAVVLNNTNGFTQKPLVLGLENNCFRLAVSSDRPREQLKSGVVHVATINFEADEEGTGELRMALDKTTVTGDNPTGGSDTYMRVTQAEGATYEIGGGEGMRLNYKVAFIGVKPSNKCAVGWQTKLVVLSPDVEEQYGPTPLNRTDEVNSKGEVVFSGTKVLSGFSGSSGVAVFFKGPKHLQVKYGVQNQTEVYNKAGGELSLSGAEGGTVYDFSEYPMLAGDVDGSGVVDGVDFALVKAKANTFEQVADGAYLKEDLDGSCQVNNIDVRLLIESLNEKQDQIY